MSAEVGQPPVDVAAEPAPVEEQSSSLDVSHLIPTTADIFIVEEY